MKKVKVACLFGGCSSEYDVSLISAASILRTINREKYEIIMVGITKTGDFYLYDGSIDKIEKDEWFDEKSCKKITISTNRSDHGIIVLEYNRVIKIDIVFPILHGKNGEDGRLQGLLELANIPYVGCDMISSGICMDKYLAHELVKSQGILTPRSYLFSSCDSYDSIIDKIKDLNYPLFVKPLRAGSSFGISKIKDRDGLSNAVKLAFFYDDKIIVEENIEGFEVGCAVLGNTDLVIGEVDEIKLQDGFFDYEEKYTLKTSSIHLPARLSEEERNRIRNIALHIYTILSCQGLARVDMFYTKDKQIVFNEVNTIPGFTSHSRYPNMLKAIGYSFEEVIDQLISLGLEK